MKEETIFIEGLGFKIELENVLNNELFDVCKYLKGKTWRWKEFQEIKMIFDRKNSN